jgi:hypothetical protein
MCQCCKQHLLILYVFNRTSIFLDNTLPFFILFGTLLLWIYYFKLFYFSFVYIYSACLLRAIFCWQALIWRHWIILLLLLHFLTSCLYWNTDHMWPLEKYAHWNGNCWHQVDSNEGQLRLLIEVKTVHMKIIEYFLLLFCLYRGTFNYCIIIFEFSL